MADILEFSEVVQEVKGVMNGGRLKLDSKGFTFRNSKTGKVEHLQGVDINKAQWLKAARGFELKIYLKNGSLFKCDGFREEDFEKLSTFLRKSFGISFEELDLSVKGWNWGSAIFNDSELSFEVEDVPAFHVPLNNVSHSTTGKNEVTLEFHQNDDAAVSLMEMRFYVPPTDNDGNLVQKFHENILAKADIIQATGDAIAKFTDIACLTPRGRYDIKIYPTFLQLHGKTFDYKIPYTTVLRLFLLPSKDQRQMFFVISVDPPIKQGQTRYHFLILSFIREEEITLQINLPESEIDNKFEGKLQKEMDGPLYEIISRVMKAVVNRKITVPGSFKGKSGTSAVSCSFKANSGFLYPLERGFIFVHKPPVHIRFDEISFVNFARSAGGTRNFDFEVETKNGNSYSFSSIEKDEYGYMFDFVKNKKLPIQNTGKKAGNVNYEEMMGSSEEELEHDAYLEQMKAEGREKIVEDGDDDNEDDDDSDSSFNPGESGSDVAEEYDSNAQSSSTSDDNSEKYIGTKQKKRDKEDKPKKKLKILKEPKKKAKKSPKDPNMPKKPQTAYFIWLNENRDKIKQDNPGISVINLTKRAGEMWSKMDNKQKWHEKAQQAKKQYDIAMKLYQNESEDNNSSKNINQETKDSPRKTGSGSQFKSREYISTEESSDEDI